MHAPSGIILSSLGVLALSCLSFVEIVELLNAIYCLAELLEFAAFVWLRVKQPDLKRPYRQAGGRGRTQLLPLPGLQYPLEHGRGAA